MAGTGRDHSGPRYSQILVELLSSDAKDLGNKGAWAALEDRWLALESRERRCLPEGGGEIQHFPESQIC